MDSRGARGDGARASAPRGRCAREEVMSKAKRPKAKGDPYRGLYKRGKRGTIYFEREREGLPRIRVSTGKTDWDEAAAFREAWLEKHEGGAVRPSELPTFAAMA